MFQQGLHLYVSKNAQNHGLAALFCRAVWPKLGTKGRSGRCYEVRRGFENLRIRGRRRFESLGAMMRVRHFGIWQLFGPLLGVF